MKPPVWEEARELDPYRDEPGQMRSGAPGKNGFLHLGFERRGERSILSKLRRRYPYFAHRALYWDEGMPEIPCVFLITTTGCILQGDRLHLDVAMGRGAQAHLTSQSGTQIHSMDANYAAQSQEFYLEEESYLEYLPDPIFPHSSARFLSETTIRKAASATMMFSEILMPGRKHLEGGERFAYDLFSSRIRVEDLQGRELVSERFLVKPKTDRLKLAGNMGDFDVFGNVFVLTTPEHTEAIWQQVTCVFDQEAGVAAGISRLPNDAGLVYKILAHESQPVTKKVREFWEIVRKVVVGRPIMEAFLWK